jgi:hypothetical protein
MTKKRETRSPIKNLPVRQAGQSIRREIEERFDKKLIPPIFAVSVTMATALYAWWLSIVDLPPAPLFMTSLLLASILWLLLSYRKNLPHFKNLNLGLIGERAVGQFLDEKLRPHEYQVLHDIPGDGFNIDHVVIGTSGIYTVETKTNSKPAKGAGSVQYDGKQITVNGFSPDRDPIVQAKAQAHWLSELFEQSTGRKFKIQPVVLYPGWFVEAPSNWPDVWVQNEKQFPATITRQKPFIGAADVHLLTYHLKLYIIAKTKEEDASA